MRLSRPNGRSMLLLHGTLLIYAVVSVFAKLAGRVWQRRTRA